MFRTAVLADAANRAAQFHAQRDDDQLPAIEVAGVFVFAYVDSDGVFRISAHWDGADVEAFPEWTEAVPVKTKGLR